MGFTHAAGRDIVDVGSAAQPVAAVEAAVHVARVLGLLPRVRSGAHGQRAHHTAGLTVLVLDLAFAQHLLEDRFHFRVLRQQVNEGIVVAQDVAPRDGPVGAPCTTRRLYMFHTFS